MHMCAVLQMAGHLELMIMMPACSVDVSTKHIPSTKPASSTKMMERQRISPYLARSSPIAYDGVEKMEEDGSFECSQGETVQSVLHGDLSFIADEHRLSV